MEELTRICLIRRKGEQMAGEKTRGAPKKTEKKPKAPSTAKAKRRAEKKASQHQAS